METYDFKVHISGNVRIDAENEEAARAEFERDFAQEAVLVTALQNQILVLAGMAWEEPTIYVDPDEVGEESDEEEDAEEV